MNIAIIYTTNDKSTKKSCKILSGKISNAEVQLIPIEIAKSDCILKYNYLILAGSAINGKVQTGLKMYISKNLKTLKGKPTGLIINCEEEKDRFNSTFTEELVKTSNIKSNFGFELYPDEGNYLQKRKTNKLINRYKENQQTLPTLNMNEIEKFADYINNMIEKRVD